MMIKIAVPTDDGITLSAHFGQAHYYKILTLEDGVIQSAELREKASHDHGSVHPEGVHPGQQMINAIADCQVLIAGGMGSPVYQRATAAGLKVILTRYQEIDLAVQAYQAGTLEDVPQLIHVH